MKFLLQYLYNNTQYSCGFLCNDNGSYNAFIIADPPRAEKIKKITRYPAGLYPLKIQTLETPLTLKHRQEYNTHGEDVWFDYHIEVTEIPGFSGCYVHIGNDAVDTDGCTLPNYAFDLTKNSRQGSLSKAATKDFYKLVYPLLKSNIPCWLEVRDEIKF